jgi:photosynthetic reaction center cytochrome c subunit
MSKSRQQIRDEMTGLLLRGGLVGLVAFAAAVGYMAIPRQLGKIHPTESVQTGPRGTGMDVVRFQSDLAETAAGIAPTEDPTPIVPEAGEPMAGGLPELAGVTARNAERLTTAIQQWVGPEAAPGGSEGYQQQITARHIEMTRAINAEWEAHVGPAGVNCNTCHRGNLVPENVWFLPVPNSRWAGPSARYQNAAMAANYSTALPVDAMATYLLDPDSQVNVHGYTSRDEDGSSNASIYKTYQTYSLMQHFANSMGANCTYCHNTRAPADPAGHTPAWATAQLGRQMTIDINNAWILPEQDLLPPERLGPLGDVAKVNCTTCHVGAPQTFGGASAIQNWPELVSAEPVYE